MQVAFLSDVGRRRKNNEDCVLVDARHRIYIVADGMGGSKAGEMASRMAAEVVCDHLVNSLVRDSAPDAVGAAMREGTLKVHQTIKFSAANNPALMGMGTTLVVTMIRDDLAIICHSGDSRAYMIRDDIRQITRDHTWGNDLVEKEGVSPEKVPRKAWHMLTQAVGVSENIDPEIDHVPLRPNDIILMCSDGLTDMVKDDEILRIVHNHKGKVIEDMVRALVDKALENGGVDNVSVLALRFENDHDFFLRTPFAFPIRS